MKENLKSVLVSAPPLSQERVTPAGGVRVSGGMPGTTQLEAALTGAQAERRSEGGQLGSALTLELMGFTRKKN